jgi:hypothetical protein
MSYSLNAWATSREDPVGAAMRANTTAARQVSDAAFDYNSAVSRGNTAEIAAAQGAFRQAWESDVRRRGGHPEEFIPNYTGRNIVPSMLPHGFFGQTEDPRMPLVKLMSSATILYILWMFFN